MKTMNMGAPSLENNLYLIWSQLSTEKREKLLSVAKELLQTEENLSSFKLSDEQWNQVLSVKEGIANGARTYSREEARKMILNRNKRHGSQD